jgi:hypothetical protein
VRLHFLQCAAHEARLRHIPPPIIAGLVPAILLHALFNAVSVAMLVVQIATAAGPAGK